MTNIQGFVTALAFAAALSAHGYRKKSLNLSGSAAAFFVGFTAFAVSTRFGLVLIVFYQSSSFLTKLKSNYKKTLEHAHKEGGQRDYVQVLSCSLIGTILAIAYALLEGPDAPATSERGTALLCAYIGHYACCNGDTWASELGVLDPWTPILVTAPWQEVPKGTNGGISLVGTVASAAGGLLIGATFVGLGQWTIPGDVSAEAPSQLGFLTLGAAAGFIGSMIDSFLGATMQASYYCDERKCIVPMDGPGIRRVSGHDVLTNEQVNMASVGLTTLISACVGGRFIH